ncbi:MAG TPA: FixH family protein [Syntrophales bacterium]|nr:FixH family protein [Syntrophales bacterium]
MKRLIAVALILLLTAGIAAAKPYEVSRKAGSYSVDIKMDKNPPIVGPNEIEIVVRDAAGKTVKDAAILVDYGMPAMPGMPAMFYKADAPLKGDKYTATLNISMKGPWQVTIKITHQEKTVSAKFTIDVA